MRAQWRIRNYTGFQLTASSTETNARTILTLATTILGSLVKIVQGLILQ